MNYWDTAVKQPEAILKLHNRYTGERLFVVGSGPSLARMDRVLLRALTDEWTFAANKLVWWPEMPFEPWIHGLSEHEDIPYLYQYHREGWATKHYICSWQPVEASGWQWVAKAPDGIWIGDVGMVGLRDDLPPFPSASSTPVTLGVQLGAWMGFDPIYLLGCDNTRTGQAFTATWVRQPHLLRTERGVARCVRDMKAVGRTLKDCTLDGTLPCNGAIEYEALEDVL